MPDTFYGPWNVRLIQADPFDSQYFTIQGSDDADGTYDVAAAQGINLNVTGGQWTITCTIREIWNPRFRARFRQRETRRATRFESPAGLLVQVDTVGLPGFSLLCTSMDPAVNPDPGANPYDFTLPG